MSATRTGRVRKSPATAGRLWIALVGVALIVPVVAVWSAALLALAGLLPTFAAFLIDREPRRPLTLAVGATNAVGVLAVVLDFQAGPSSLTAALDTLTQGVALLVMFGAASAGWMLHLGLPAVARILLLQADEAQRRALKHRQEALVEEWGPEVAGPDEETPGG